MTHIGRTLTLTLALIPVVSIVNAQLLRGDDSQSPGVSYYNPAELPSSRAYSHTALVDGGRLIFVSGQQALDAQGRLVGRGDFKVQAQQVFANVRRALAAAGADVSDVIAIQTHYVNRADLPAYAQARADFFAERSGPPPTSTTVQVSGLVADGALLEVGVTAIVPQRTASDGPASPISVVAKLRARPGQADRLQDVLRANAEKTRRESGCLMYSIHRSVDDDHLFVLYERWTTRDALARHFEMPYMKELSARRAELYEHSEITVARAID